MPLFALLVLVFIGGILASWLQYFTGHTPHFGGMLVVIAFAAVMGSGVAVWMSAPFPRRQQQAWPDDQDGGRLR